MILRIVKIAVPLVVVILSGFLLRKQGQPYSQIVFNLHKLLALGVFIAILVISINQIKASGFTVTQSVLFSGFLILFIATIATGGVVSAMANPPGFVLLLHKLLPYLTISLSVAIIAAIPLTGTQT